MSSETLLYLLPAIVLAAAATLIYVGGAGREGRSSWLLVAAVALATAAGVLYWQYAALFLGGDGRPHPRLEVPPPLAVDLFFHYVQWLVLLCGGLLVAGLWTAQAHERLSETVGSLLLVLAGLILAAGSRDLVLLFLGLELVSIPTYVLLYVGRRGPGGQEATVKYFFLSVLSSAILLYGFSFLYGAAGSTDLGRLGEALAGDGLALGAGRGLAASVGLVLTFAGLGFRLAAVPFHFYAPDVYQGSSHWNAGLLSVVPKIAGVTVLVRIGVSALPDLDSLGWRLALVLAALTMTLGNVVALWQDNLRRMLAYSSIAHGGYLLVALAAALAAPREFNAVIGFGGGGAALAYLSVYALGTLGFFTLLQGLSRDGRSLETIDDLAGLSSARPLAAAMLAVCLFSLAGIPPLAGFWGKFYVFTSALETAWSAEAGSALRWCFGALAVVGVLNAAVGAAYYLRLISAMYFRSGPPAQVAVTPGSWLAGGVGAALVVILGLWARPIFVGAAAADESARSLSKYRAHFDDPAQPIEPRSAEPLGPPPGMPSLPGPIGAPLPPGPPPPSLPPTGQEDAVPEDAAPQPPIEAADVPAPQ